MDKININNLFANAKAGRNGEINVSNMFDYDEDQTLATVELNIDRMLEMKEEKRKLAQSQYYKLFKLCIKKINDAISIGENKIIYEIPYDVPLVTEYSFSECMEYINNKIKKLHMDTIIVSQLSIFISWEFIEENRKENK